MSDTVFTKQKPPRLVIVDGQQRLTSLYAVVKGVPVYRENYESERIRIAFNPLEERFEVFDAAIERDKSFIPDISRIWSGGANIFKVANEYLSGLQSTREVSDEEVEKIQNAFTKLQSLLTFPFTALELASDISEEDVSEVFVRINSRGTPLNQADFILTLMSVFWDEGRAELEQFCREARKPTKGKASPFNYFNDFWAVTLPNDLATSSPRSPSLFAYNASLVLLDAKALFSKSKVAELLDPAIQAHRAAVERHHLFPKGYLAKQNITATRDTNQIANYAYVEWIDNMKISDESPVEYVPKLKERFNEAEPARMYHYHALPENWEQMDYSTFLEKRREMMAQIIREGYRTLTTGVEHETKPGDFDLTTVITNGESEAVEFKSTLRTNLHTGEPDKRMEQAALKTLAGLLNTSGGTLVVGMADDGNAVGIEADNFPNEDKMSLHLVNIVKIRIDPPAMTSMHIHFEDYDANRVMVIRCKKSPVPVFVKERDIERFYVRTGPSTTELPASQAQDYIRRRFRQ